MPPERATPGPTGGREDRREPSRRTPHPAAGDGIRAGTPATAGGGIRAAIRRRDPGRHPATAGGGIRAGTAYPGVGLPGRPDGALTVIR